MNTTSLVSAHHHDRQVVIGGPAVLENAQPVAQRLDHHRGDRSRHLGERLLQPLDAEDLAIRGARGFEQAVSVDDQQVPRLERRTRGKGRP